MSKKSFLTVADGSTVIFDADQAKNFQVTLEGSRSIVIAGGQDGDEISILLIQGGSGSYVPTWPSSVSWQTGAAPNLSTSVGNSDLITLVKKGSTWKDKAGSASRLPSRIRDAALGAIVGMSVVALSVISSGGGNNRPGTANLADIQNFCTGSSCTVGVKVGKMTASGQLVIGASGGLVIGSPTLNAFGTDAEFIVKKTGDVVARGNLSGTTLDLHQGAGSGRVKIFGGDAAVCLRDTDNAGWTRLDALNGTLTATQVSGIECN